jgi:hypothetical protein
MTELPEEPPQASWRARGFALGIIAVTGVAATLLLVRSQRTDTAALFVGVPLLLALVVTLAPPTRNLHGLTFRAVTFGLLITSAFLHEGAACVLMAAPLVYGVAHLWTALVVLERRDKERRRSALVLVPLLLLASLEGLVFRIDPGQTVVEERVVAMSPAEVEQRLGQGPDFAATRPALLRFSGYPTPTAATGAGLALGARWTFTMAGGPITTEVVARTDERVEFAVVSDASKTQRWLTWVGAVVSWSAVEGGSRVRIEATFIRRLDPSWYFGPIEQRMVAAGIEHFADSLGLRPVERRDD